MIRVIHTEPPTVISKASEVVVVGPDNLDLSLAPGAAVRTAEELVKKAGEAIGKQAASNAYARTRAPKRD
jgi:hypothetical protein